MNMAEKRKKKHYINNKKFQELLVAHNKYPEDRIVLEQLGKKFTSLANRIAAKGNFADYQIDEKNDFIADAIYHSYLKISSYDQDRFTNPFAFFTSVCMNKFREHLKRNKKFKELHTSVDAVEMNASILFMNDSNRDKMNYAKIRQNEINR